MDDEERWAEAEQILRGTPDVAVQQRISRRRTRVLVVGVAVIVALLVVAGVIGWVVGSRDHGHVDSSSVPTWVSVVGFGVQMVGLLIGVVGLVAAGRAGNWRWKTPASPLSRAQKRDLREQVVGKAPADPARLHLARDLARRITQQRYLLVIFAGVAVTQLGGAIGTPEAWRFGLVGLLVVLLGLTTVQIERDIRRARRFLEQNDAPFEPAGLEQGQGEDAQEHQGAQRPPG